jgi:type I restriction enzyme R subunit
MTLIKRDEEKAHAQLANTPFNYGFPLRYYQQDAILATEKAIETGQREMLLAMATGTGKTKTCIALLVRSKVKTTAFRRSDLSMIF